MSQTYETTTTRKPEDRGESGQAKKTKANMNGAEENGAEAKARADEKKAQPRATAEDVKSAVETKAERPKTRARQATEQVKAKAAEVERDPRVQQARAHAEEKAREARSFAYEQARAQQARASVRVSNVASALRAAGRDLSEKDEPMADYAQLASDKIDEFARYLSERDPEEIVMQAEASARNNPALFVGGAFALGFLGARFLKAGAERRNPDAIVVGGEAEPQLPARTSSAREDDRGLR